ncbi:MAG TPA: hypothetical protein VMQ59_00210 [Acidimicrobiales bacterium]|nr:hypothetical protein [Acidimicrobiales bacterium]
MAKASIEIRGCLSVAAKTNALVRIDRSIKKADRLEGYLVGLGRRWALLQLVSHDWLLNGYGAIRVGDVKRVRRWDDRSDFPARALAHFDQTALPIPGIELDSVRSLIESAAQRSSLVTVFVEDARPDVCFVGRALSVSDRRLRLSEIDPGAVWKHEPTKLDLRDVTRVEFGGRYEEALAALAGGSKGI